MSSAGQGSISISQKPPVIPAPGPPFLPTSADNGLSVDPVTGRIVFGNDVGDIIEPAALLSDREIPTDGFGLIFTDTVNNFLLSLYAANFLISDLTTGNNTGLNPGSIGLEANNPGQQLLFRMSDIPAGDDFNLLLLNSLLTFEGASQHFLSFDFLTRAVSIGDTSSTFNGTRMLVDDANQIVRLQSSTELMLFLAPQAYSLGNVDDTINGSKISIDDLNRSLVFSSLTENRMMAIEGNFNKMRLGDIDVNTNGLVFTVDPGADNFVFENAANTAGILINGVAGFTGTVAAPATITVNNGIVTNVV